MTAILYCVASPIGNLGDITARALQVLTEVDRIYAEDTRVSAKLLNHFGIKNSLSSLHDHNESQRIQQILAELGEGLSVALISDAGTPLISDPGYKLVTAVAEAGFRVIPIPGASAVIAALSVAGLPTDRFGFEGFLPAKSSARRAVLEALSKETKTLVFYESNHRVVDFMQDIVASFGQARYVVIGRELTKLYEQVYRGSAVALLEQLQSDAAMRKGEFVIMTAGFKPTSEQDSKTLEVEQLLQILLDEGLSVSQSAKIAARISGQPKNKLYRKASVLAE